MPTVIDLGSCAECCDSGCTTPNGCCDRSLPCTLTASDGTNSVELTWVSGMTWEGDAVGTFAGCTAPHLQFILTCTSPFNIFLGILYVAGNGSAAATPICGPPFYWSSTISAGCASGTTTVTE